MVSFTRDEGRPFGIGFQEQISNHLKRLQLRVEVASVKEKSMEKKWEGDDQEGERKKTTEEASLRGSNDIKMRDFLTLSEKLIGNLVIG